jgi:hypothetical protein
MKHKLLLAIVAQIFFRAYKYVEKSRKPSVPIDILQEKADTHIERL